MLRAARLKQIYSRKQQHEDTPLCVVISQMPICERPPQGESRSDNSRASSAESSYGTYVEPKTPCQTLSSQKGAVMTTRELLLIIGSRELQARSDMPVYVEVAGQRASAEAVRVEAHANADNDVESILVIGERRL